MQYMNSIFLLESRPFLYIFPLDFILFFLLTISYRRRKHNNSHLSAEKFEYVDGQITRSCVSFCADTTLNEFINFLAREI